MRVLHLDFVSRPGILRRVGYVLLIVAVAGAAYLGQAYANLSADLVTWEAKWRSLQKTPRNDAEPGPKQKAEWEQLQAELKAANRVITRISMPWDVLFREVEASVDEQITLLGIEPDTEKREVRIVAEAKNLTAMLDYMKRLRTVAVFRDVHVLSHQIQQQDPQKPVRFVVTAQWLESLQPQAEAH